jgi:hypothetical protein
MLAAQNLLAKFMGESLAKFLQFWEAKLTNFETHHFVIKNIKDFDCGGQTSLNRSKTVGKL